VEKHLKVSCKAYGFNGIILISVMLIAIEHWLFLITICLKIE
jgi:hypothetical protein